MGQAPSPRPPYRASGKTGTPKIARTLALRVSPSTRLRTRTSSSATRMTDWRTAGGWTSALPADWSFRSFFGLPELFGGI